MNHSTRNCIHLLVVAAVMIGIVANPVSAFAMPPEPIDPDPVGEPEGRIAPVNGFEWSVPPRFGLYSNGIVNFNWDELNGKYYSTYVHPENFPVNFDGCRTDADEESGTSSMTYTWQVDGHTIAGHACRIQYAFDQQGTYPVRLTITRTDGSVLLDEQGRGDPFQQDILVRDILIVSLGDSRASGEGSPDRAQVLGNPNPLDPFNQPLEVVHPVEWQDSRCHRSARSGHAQAAMAIEWADPHTSVTFLSFACSGATINRPQYGDASTFDPYRNPDSYGWTKALGTGILGAFAGTEPPDPDHPQDNQLPSQIDQLMAALTNDGQVPARPVDALLITAGGNDIYFGDIAALCTIYKNCPSLPVTDPSFNYGQPLQDRVQADIDALAGRFATLASVISDTVPFSPNGEVYITQYDDPTRNTGGSFCTKMLDDVMPDWMGLVLLAAALLEGAPTQPISVPYNVSSTEVEWAAGIPPALNQAIAEAAQAHGWTLVDGILDDTANLFSGHGYCAANNWVRRAEESVIRQGPWVNWLDAFTTIPPVSTLTRGTLHPTDAGYWMIAQRIVAKLAPNLLPSPPANPPAPPTFTSSSNQSLLGENGWLTGHTVGVACPAGAANCAFAQVEAHTASDTEMRGVSLLVNGASPTCSETGVTTDGITCQARLTNAQTYNWSFAFANDGIYQLEFKASARNGAASQFSQAVKVDLYDPVGTQTLSAPTPDSGWYTAPVSVTVTAADGSGSGVQSIEYELDGAAAAASGNSVSLVIETDGSHSVGYQVVDFAGRTSTPLAFSIKVDLHDPVFNPLPGPFQVDEGSSTTLTAQAGEGNSVVLNYDWDLDNDGTFETTDEQPTFSAAALDGPTTQTVGVRVTDEAGRSTTTTATVNVLNVEPSVEILKESDIGYEGTEIILGSSVSDPGAADTFTYAWTVKKNGSDYTSGTGADFRFTPDDNGSYEVSVSVTDDDGGVGTASQTVTVDNVAPALNNVNVTPGTVNEGDSVTLGGDLSDPGSADSFGLTIDWGDGGTPELVSLPAGSTSFSRSHTYADDNPTGTASDTYPIALTIADDDAGTGTGSASVVVNNLAPNLSVSAPESGALYAVNATVDLSASLTDPSSLDTLTCSVNWGDGATGSGTVAAGACTASHVYTTAGVYTIQMTGTDDDTGAKTESVMVVVYDPSAGFVTGGGWIDSPAGAYKPDLNLSGRATFGFVSKYKKGAQVPTGTTQFQFNVAGLSFYSETYEWLVVNQGGTNAQFKGSGLINGAADPNGQAYKFMLWAGDGSPDTFHIRIWWEDDAGEHDVYDNGTDQAIGAGNIMVHTGK